MTGRRSATRPLTAALALAVAALVLTARPALGHGPDPTLGSEFWAKDAALTFRWRAGEVPPAGLQAAIKEAAADSNASRASRAATYAYKSTGTNPIEYGLDVTCGVNGIACFTRNVPAGFTMGFREHGHRFDWGTLKWCQMLAKPWPNGCFDVENVALDEFGHIEGLGHHVNHANDSDYLDAVVQTVSHTKPNVGWNAHVYGRCDVATLQKSYDVPAATTRISTCLDLATALTLSASSTAIPAGSSVTLTATLKIGSSSAYGQLSGNALSGRVVVLQRRAPWVATWSTLATMAAGASAGTYVTSTTPSATYEYRAVYTAPSTEGLRSDSTGVVTVEVVPTCTASAARSELVPCA